jgi:hypothetical protein
VLGALLVEAGRARDAEQVYREDLKRFRENGWSLFGLAQSLERQGRTAEANVIRGRFATAWQRADITLTSSRVLTSSEKFASLSTSVQMEYVERGSVDGLPVVVLHGVTDSWRSFERVLPLLRVRHPHFRVVGARAWRFEPVGDWLWLRGHGHQ